MKKWWQPIATVVMTIWLACFSLNLLPKNNTFFIIVDKEVISLSVLSLLITFVIIAGLIASIVASFITAKKEENKDESLFELQEEYAILANSYENNEQLMDSINSITSKKTRNYIDSFDKEDRYICDTNIELRTILEEIVDYFSDMTKISRNLFGASLLYQVLSKSGEYGEWVFYPIINIDNTLNKDELINNENTTARQIIDKKHSSIFFEDKRIGMSEGEYIPDPKDIDNDNIGSIICRDVSLPMIGDKHYVRAVLTITTHGQQIICKSDVKARNAILNVVLPCFENHIREILSKLYLNVKEE